LRAAGLGASPEQGRRLDDLIARYDARLEPSGLTRSALRKLRALEVLERIGTAEARRLVQAVAASEVAVLSAEARLIVARWHETTAGR
jgi:hypothetical protein